MHHCSITRNVILKSEELRDFKVYVYELIMELKVFQVIWNHVI
jgi:hypothetical protein